MLVHAGASALLEMFIGSARPYDANHRTIETTAFDHMVEGWENLPMSQVPHRSEENQRIGRFRIRARAFCRAALSEIWHC